MSDKAEIYGEWEEQLLVYKGILFNNAEFACDFRDGLSYDFECKEYRLLNEKYALSEIAGDGSEFERASRLTAYFAPKLTHKGDFDGSIPSNALALLEYALERPEHGINCVAKAKILQECCLAIGIYARRLWLMPYSPYDGDCHSVTEIFDTALHKWIMLDLTTNGCFTDGNKTPLSVLEMRENFAFDSECNFTKANDSVAEYFESAEAERLYYNKYFAKNLFYIAAQKVNGFGDDGSRLKFLPRHFDDGKREKQNSEFRLKSLGGVQVRNADFERSIGCDIECLQVT